MKKITTLFIILLVLPLLGHSQFISLENEKFKLNGSEFTPVICNYMISVAYIINLDLTKTYLITPNPGYGSNSGYGCSTPAECLTRIQTDFHAMALMGFNTVRIMDLRVAKDNINVPDCSFIDNNLTVFKVKCLPFNNFLPCDILYWPIHQPYDANNSDLSQLLGLYDEVLNIAQQETLKVILVPAGGSNLVNLGMAPVPSYSGEPSIGDQQAADYEAYLSYFSSHFSNNTSLFAYDLINEPQWSDQDYWHPKKKICQWVGRWYDAIKANDAHHLVTMGLSNIHDVFEWDPAVMKLDFESQHVYPDFFRWDNPINLQTLSRTRYAKTLGWLKKYHSKPWMIGETGFAANDLNTDAGYRYWPYIWGSENDRRDFIDFSIGEVKGSGALGYSWWMFQDVQWFPVARDDAYHQNWFGMLRPAEPIGGLYDASHQKTGNNLILGYQSAPSTHIELDQSQSYNFNHIDPNSNSIRGTVSDQNGNLVTDAVAMGWSISGYDDNTGAAEFDFFLSLTDENGNFTLTGKYYNLVSNSGHVNAFWVSAPGSDVFYANWSPNNVYPINLGYNPMDMNLNFTNIIIDRVDFRYDKLFTDLEIASGQNENYTAYNSITLKDNIRLDPFSQSSFKARNYIHLQAECHAFRNAEAHFFCGETQPECAEQQGSGPYGGGTGNGRWTSSSTGKEITLKINKEKDCSKIELFPNPNNGSFTLKSDCNIQGYVELYSLTGIHLQELKFDTELKLEFNDIVDGVYILVFKRENGISEVKKLIINHN